MNGRAVSLRLAVALAGAGVAVVGLGLLPQPAPPPPQRIDLRQGLQDRHRALSGSTPAAGAQASEPPPSLAQLDVDVLCEQPVPGTLSSWPDGAGLAALVPCDEGAALLHVGAAGPPERRLRLRMAGLRLGPAQAFDLDGDGQRDLLIAAHADGPEAQHQRGLYWIRGREAGGFEEARRLASGRVIALVPAASPAEQHGLWMLVAEPEPQRRSLLWFVAAGAAPERTGRWEVPEGASDLALTARPGDDGPRTDLWGLSRGTVWRLSPRAGDADAAPEPVLEAPGSRGFVQLAEQLYVATPTGLRRVRVEDDGVSLAEPEGPGNAEAAVALASGLRVGAAGGALWSWRPGGEVQALSGVGGARVESVIAPAGLAHVFLSGLLGGRATGLMRITPPWPPESPVELVARPPGPGAFAASLTLP